MASPVDFRVVGGQHATIARGDDLTRVKRKAGNIAVRLADSLPMIVPQYFAAQRAGRVLD